MRWAIQNSQKLTAKLSSLGKTFKTSLLTALSQISSSSQTRRSYRSISRARATQEFRQWNRSQRCQVSQIMTSSGATECMALTQSQASMKCRLPREVASCELHSRAAREGRWKVLLALWIKTKTLIGITLQRMSEAVYHENSSAQQLSTLMMNKSTLTLCVRRNTAFLSWTRKGGEIAQLWSFLRTLKSNRSSKGRLQRRFPHKP